MLYPLKFEPIFKEKIWGGNNLKKYLNKNIDKNKKIGESWEIDDYLEFSSVVSNGDLKKRTLNEILKEYKRDLLGLKPDKKYLKTFPLLIKFLDANDKLSVQVHPDDKYAEKNENGGSGKTELWYIIHAKPGAKMVVGLVPGITKKDFIKNIGSNEFEDVLHYIEIKTGDVIFIPPGCVHTAMAGLVIHEIQQNSDTTYRVYDWGRKGQDGKPRELHIDKFLDVIKFNNFAHKVPLVHSFQVGTNIISTLAKCSYFKVEKYILNEKIKFISDKSSFSIISLIDGYGVLTWEKKEIELNKGETILIPASITSYTIYPRPGVTIIKSSI